ncbi:NlpC/P60 family protein [uncultured Allobaculum sp.]|uniref:NlpC/P60 family protein n=1 Tax=uncultured Allobaculum sp. TaxID=1187017 RepID=UPI0025985491|nr:NlpC/P60 family protein [uncultured Allobaculum sp.]
MKANEPSAVKAAAAICTLSVIGATVSTITAFTTSEAQNRLDDKVYAAQETPSPVQLDTKYYLEAPASQSDAVQQRTLTDSQAEDVARRELARLEAQDREKAAVALIETQSEPADPNPEVQSEDPAAQSADLAPNADASSEQTLETQDSVVADAAMNAQPVLTQPVAEQPAAQPAANMPAEQVPVAPVPVVNGNASVAGGESIPESGVEADNSADQAMTGDAINLDETITVQPILPVVTDPVQTDPSAVTQIPEDDLPSDYDPNAQPPADNPPDDQPPIDDPNPQPPITPNPPSDVDPGQNQPGDDDNKPAGDYSALNAAIAQSALSLVGTTDGLSCTEVVQLALAKAGVSDAMSLWPKDYAAMYGYYTDTPQPGNLIYYEQGGNGLDHIAIYIGNGMAVHGNYVIDGKGYTKIAPVETGNYSYYAFIQVCR